MVSSLCEICHTNVASVSAIVNDTFYKYVCSSCNAKKSQVSSGHARWMRGVDVEDHQFDLAQPWNADGTPNVDFIRAYPKQSAAVFTQEQMDKAVRL